MKADSKGFTLIELIMFIIIGAIFLPASMIAFTSVMSNYSRPDHYVKARFYADKRMAEIISKPYDEISPSSLSPCPDTDEGGEYKTTCVIQLINPFDLSNESLTSNYYKRVTVKVKYSDLLIEEISTIVTKRPNAS